VKLGLLHPGAMGVSVGEAMRSAGHEVLWISDGRSAATCQRAQGGGFSDCGSLAALVESVEGIVSVCPPDQALTLARAVISAGYTGVYLDANAVSPDTAREIYAVVGEDFVDGGIVGPPATQPGSTRLYLSGERAAQVATWFDGGYLDAQLVAGPPGSASALKMCYAAYTKGTSALLLAIRALAAAEGVEAGLLQEWSISQPALTARSQGAARGSAPKAWRFAGEMEEIAATFAAQDLPDGFHLAARDVYRRLEAFKDQEEVSLESVLEALRSH
jgi:3-hydroxyisobutyrate dehydrogenase-like beta-hydroxyacid dehydrogenase